MLKIDCLGLKMCAEGCKQTIRQTNGESDRRFYFMYIVTGWIFCDIKMHMKRELIR